MEREEEDEDEIKTDEELEIEKLKNAYRKIVLFSFGNHRRITSVI